MKGFHLIVVWPELKHLSQSIYVCLKEANGEIIDSFDVYPNSENAEKFIDKIYENSSYEKRRVEKKKANILKNVSKGITIIIFSIENGCLKWSNERNRYVSPNILDLKQAIRDRLKQEVGSISKYETIHMSNDQNEFNHDLLASIRLKNCPRHIGGNMRIGIIGAGYVATIHSKAIQMINPDISRYIYDTRMETAQKFAKEHGCQVVENKEDFYDSVDAVIIATPTSTHYKLVMESMIRGKHILCEKPMAALVSEASDMFAMSREKNLVCAIGFNYRFFEITKILKETVEIGDFIQIDILINRLFRKDRKNTDDGVLSDLGIHLIDLITYLCNQNIDLESCRVCMKRTDEVDYDTTVYGKTEKGISFKLAAARIEESNEVRFCIDIAGTRGNFKYDSRQDTIYTIEKNHNTQTYHFEKTVGTSDFFDFTDSILRQDMEWINAILEGPITKLATFKDGLQSQATLDNFLNKKTLY